MPNTVVRYVGYTNTVEQLIWTGAGADVPVRAYLIGGGGGGGGALGGGIYIPGNFGYVGGIGGNGSGGGYASVDFVVRANDQITIAVGGAGGYGVSAVQAEGGGSAGGAITAIPIFNTRNGPGIVNVGDYKSVFDPNWGTFLNTYGVWEVLNGSYYSDFNKQYSVYFSETADYTFTMSASHPAILILNGTPVFSCTTAISTFEQSVTVSQGFNTIQIRSENTTGGPAGVALAVAGGGQSFSAGRGGNAGGVTQPVIQGSTATDPFFGTIVPGTSGYYEYGRGYISGANNFEDFFNPSSWCVVLDGSVVYGPTTTPPPATLAIRRQSQGRVYYQPDGFPSLEYTAVVCYSFIYSPGTNYGAGGGGGGATVLLLNNVLQAVAGGGAGGGGSGYQSFNVTPGNGRNAPGGGPEPRREPYPITNGQNGQNPNGGGGGHGGGGGGYNGGNGGRRTGGLVDPQEPGNAGEYGASYSRNGVALNSGNRINAGYINQFNYQPYSDTNGAGTGGDGEKDVFGGTLGVSWGQPGLVVLEFDVQGLYVHTNNVFTPVQKTYVNSNGQWYPVVTTWLNQNNIWVPVRGSIAPVFNQHPEQFGVNSRVALSDPGAPPQGGGGGGKCKIICQKLAEMGFFDSAMNAADQQFGIMLQDQDPDAYNGYLRWAQPVVELLEGKGSATFRKIAFFWVRDEQRRQQIQSNIVAHYLDVIARPWAEEMAYRMKADGYDQSNPAGRFIMNIGLPMCRAIGRFGKRGQWPMWAKTALIWGTTTVLLVAVSVISGTDKFVGKVCKLFKRG